MTDTLLQELDALATGHWLTDMANFSAFLYQRVPHLNWVGFYLSDGEKLRLGPFAGLPACVEIAFSRGVCGAAFSQKKVMNVKDVHEFPGHIACDANSRSELVIPFSLNGKLVGVLDVDSPNLSRFTEAEENLFSAVASILQKKVSESWKNPF